MIKRILDKLFYSPTKFAKKCPFVSVDDSTVLLSTARFIGVSEGNSVKLGSDSMIGCMMTFESNVGDIEIGSKCYISSGTNIISRNRVSIGNHVTIAWGCTIYDHNSHSLDYLERQNDIVTQLEDYRCGRNFITSKNWSTVKSSPIVIEDNVWLGFGVTILKGVTIGEGAIVSAGSVVRSSIPSWVVVAGNPATVVKYLKES